MPLDSGESALQGQRRSDCFPLEFLCEASLRGLEARETRLIARRRGGALIPLQWSFSRYDPLLGLASDANSFSRRYRW